MENLQIKAGDVYKLVVICISAVAYYFSLKNSMNLLKEKLKTLKANSDCQLEKNREDHKEIYGILRDKADKK